MSTIPEFNTPANWSEFPAGDPRQAALRAAWSQNLNRWTQLAILGDPWGSINDQNRAFFVNPLTFSQAAPTTAPTLISWNAFPGRFGAFYGSSMSPYDLFAMADYGGPPQMPTSICAPIDDDLTVYTPVGPRGWQDEYCEWAVERDSDGNILKIIFTCENPEYWLTLWSIDPNRVLAIYQDCIGSSVVMEDLVMLDENGDPLIDPATGAPAYNPLNKWNIGTHLATDHGGAMHLTSSPNTLGAEIYLAAAATLLRKDSNGNQIVAAGDLICCSRYGRPARNSDPHIGASVNAVVSAGNFVTLADPVGLYIQDPDPSQFTFPTGLTLAQCWTVKRGTAGGHTLQAVFTVPSGFKSTEIQVNGVPLRFASQIAQTFEIGLYAWAWSTAMEIPLLTCPKSKTNPQPSIQGMQDAAVFAAYRQQESQATGENMLSIPILAYPLTPGTTVTGSVLLTNGSAEDGCTVVVPEGGVTIQVQSVGTIQGLGGPVQFLNVVVTVADNAQPGDRTVQIANPGRQSGPASFGVMTVLPPSLSTPEETVAVAGKQRTLRARNRFSRL